MSKQRQGVSAPEVFWPVWGQFKACLTAGERVRLKKWFEPALCAVIEAKRFVRGQLKTYDQRATDASVARRHFKALVRCNRLSMALRRYGLMPELRKARGGDP